MYKVFESEYGRGIKSTKRIRKGTVVLVSEIIKLREDDLTSDSVLWSYVFSIKEPGYVGVVISDGSLFNHSKEPNLYYSYEKSTSSMVFVATTDIDPDTELLIDYNYDPVVRDLERKVQKIYNVTGESIDLSGSLIDKDLIDSKYRDLPTI